MTFIRVVPSPLLPATPPATNDLARRSMRGNRRSNTKPETDLRSVLHARGLRFRKDFRVVGAEGVASRADIVFTRARVAIFVDGCFWHGCSDHCRMPRANREYWTAKIERNVLRDRRVTEALQDAGWLVVRLWEHVALDEAATRVEGALSGRKRTFGG